MKAGHYYASFIIVLLVDIATAYRHDMQALHGGPDKFMDPVHYCKSSSPVFQTKKISMTTGNWNGKVKAEMGSQVENSPR